MAAIKKYNGSTWETTTARKYETATETIQSGDTIYADGTAATISLKGNEQHTGTPSPQNPVVINGVGERTEQLVPDISTSNGWRKGYLSNGNYMPTQYYGEWLSPMVSLNGLTEFTISAKPTSNASMSVYWFDGSNYLSQTNATDYTGSTFDTIPSNATQFCYAIRTGVNGDTPPEGWWTMLNSGSTAKPYEPYGYKIPILNGQQTTNIYLGSTQTVRQIKKIVFDGTEDWNLHTTYPSLFTLRTITDELFIEDRTVICNCYVTIINIGAGYVRGKQICFFYGSNINHILYIKDTDYADATEFKAYLAQQYANGTPVTIWYILATPETGIVNEPLMKIGTYADSISGISLPTTDGANTITVDTTVQPSEVTATWTGWHDSSVKEWDGTNWN